MNKLRYKSRFGYWLQRLFTKTDLTHRGFKCQGYKAYWQNAERYDGNWCSRGYIFTAPAHIVDQDGLCPHCLSRKNMDEAESALVS